MENFVLFLLDDHELNYPLTLNNVKGILINILHMQEHFMNWKIDLCWNDIRYWKVCKREDYIQDSSQVEWCYARHDRHNDKT